MSAGEIVPPSAGLAGDRDQRLSAPTLLEAAYRVIEDLGQPWLVLSEVELVPRRGLDAHVLIEEPDSIDTLRLGLQALGLTPVPPAVTASDGSHWLFLGYDEENHHWVRLDVGTRLDFGYSVDSGVRSGLAKEVTPALLARRARGDQTWRLSDTDAFWSALLTQLLGLGELDLEHLPLTANVTADGPVAAVIDAAAVSGGSSGELLALAQRHDAHRLEELRPLLRSAWERRRNGGLRTRASTARATINRAIGATRHPPGINIAIIGPDGAGKTTLAEGLRESLPVDSRYVYMGVWKAYRGDRLMSYLPGSRLALRMLRLGYRSLEDSVHRARGRVVLLDRFTYDALLPERDLDRRGRLTVRLVRRVSADPQLVVVLDAPAELMFARKGEQGIEKLEERRLSYLEMARTRPDSVVIDARQSIEVVRAEAEKAVWLRLQRHWNHLAST